MSIFKALALLAIWASYGVPVFALNVKHMVVAGTESRMNSKNTLLAQARLQADAELASLLNDDTLETPGSFAQFSKKGVMPGDDFLSQIRFSLPDARSARIPPKITRNALQPEPTAFVETGTRVTKVQSFCEICILVMQMKERGQPHLCAGLNDAYYITCVEVLISLLRADKALVYWLKNGCMHMDVTGPEIVRPCPALNICSWVPNLFSQPPSIVRDGVESLCPKDNKFLPTIPQEYRDLLLQDSAAAGSPPSPPAGGAAPPAAGTAAATPAADTASTTPPATAPGL